MLILYKLKTCDVVRMSLEFMYTLSIIIPAYNEEKNIEAAMRAATAAINEKISDYEILIFDDGSSDKTGEIADTLAKENPHIIVIHNKPNKGFGYNFIKGVEMAKMEYLTVVPGDNEILHESIKDIFSKIGEADIIAAYHQTPKARALKRRILSRCYTAILNLLFGLRLRYYNGPHIFRTDLLRENMPSTFGFGFAAEMMIKLIKWRGCSYVHVGMKVRPTDRTTAFKFKNIISVFKTISKLFFDTYFTRK